MFGSNRSGKFIKKDGSISFEEIYNEYKTAVYNYLLLRTKNDKDVSKDILSETFCSFIEGASSLKNFKNIRNYLLQIANRRLNDYLRKVYHDKKYDEYFDQEDASDDILAEQLFTKEQLLMVNTAMDKLSPAFKEVIRLKYTEEKSQNEISAIIGKSVSAVETLLFRARKQLRNELKKLKGFADEI